MGIRHTWAEVPGDRRPYAVAECDRCRKGHMCHSLECNRTWWLQHLGGQCAPADPASEIAMTICPPRRPAPPAPIEQLDLFDLLAG